MLYTDSFNVAPEVQLSGPPQMLKNVGAMFTATATDRNERSDRLDFEWFWIEVQGPQSCPGTPADARAQERRANRVDGVAAMQEITLPRLGFFCVWVLVTDRAGASGLGSQRFEVKNQIPTAALQLVSPKPLRWDGPTAYVPLYSDLRVSADTSNDPENEALEYRWRITGRDGEIIPAVPCSGTSKPNQICQRLDATGKYSFVLKTWDGLDESAAAELPILVMPDAPPCIEQTEPSYQLPRIVVFSTERTTLRVVQVSDDGDAYPAGPGQQPQTTFVWRYKQVGSPEGVQRYVTNMPTFGFVPDRFRPGDEVEVQLDVLDRVPDRDFTSCDGEPDCRIDPDRRECWQRVTWRVSYL